MILNLFKSKSKLGIDIGTSAIKIVQLGQQAGRFVLENYAMYEIAAESGATPASILALEDAQIADALKGAITRAGITAKDATVSISSVSTFATVIEMPYTTEEELAKAIPFEARKYIPIPLDKVVLDWSIIGVVGGGDVPQKAPASTPGAETSVEVFLAAVPKDETSRYQRIVQQAGLNLVALELENSSLIRGLLGNDLSPTAIMNIGGRSTSILVVSKGYERLSHNYEVGGYELTKAIAQALNVPMEKAEEMKRAKGIEEGDNPARQPMVALVDMIIFETKKIIATYEEAHHQKIPRVVIVGGIADMPGFARYVKQRIDRDILVGNVFARVVYPPELTPAIQSLSNKFVIATGAAMREG